MNSWMYHPYSVSGYGYRDEHDLARKILDYIKIRESG